MSQELEQKIAELASTISEQKKELVNLKRKRAGVETDNYVFKNGKGETVELYSLFDETDELLIIHNMGKSCAWCTLWADGFNGFANHLDKRLPWFVSSPDDPETMTKFAESRAWKFNMLSNAGSTFTVDMGFKTDEGFLPGFSIFHRQNDGKVYHTAYDHFGPGDEYMPIYPILDLLPMGANDWDPTKAY